MTYHYVHFRLLDHEYLALELLPLLEFKQQDREMIQESINSVINKYINHRVSVPLRSVSILIQEVYILMMKSRTDIDPLYRQFLDIRTSALQMFPPVFHKRSEGLPPYRCLRRTYDRKSLRRLFRLALSLSQKEIVRINDSWMIKGSLRKKCISGVKWISKTSNEPIEYTSENDLYLIHNGSMIAIEGADFE